MATLAAVFSQGPGEVVFFPSSATQFIGTVAQSTNSGIVGWTSGDNYKWRERYTFVPSAALDQLTVTFTYTSSNGVINPFKTGVVTGEGTALPGTSTSFSFDTGTKKATVTLTGSFAAGTTYCLWLWYDSSNYCYVNGMTASAVSIIGREA